MAVSLLRAVVAAWRSAWPTRLVCFTGGPFSRLSPLMLVGGARHSHEQKLPCEGNRDRSGPISAAKVSAVSTPTVGMATRSTPSMRCSPASAGRARAPLNRAAARPRRRLGPGRRARRRCASRTSRSGLAACRSGPAPGPERTGARLASCLANADQLGALPRVRTQRTQLVRRAKRTAQEPVAHQLPDPLAVQNVTLAATHLLGRPRIHQMHLEPRPVQHLEHRNPVHPRRLQRHLTHAALLKPRGHRLEVLRERRELRTGRSKRDGSTAT